MLFYALRVGCHRCGSAFLVGGDRGNDLARWRRLEVECPHCHERTQVGAGLTVTLGGFGTGEPSAPGAARAETHPV